MADKDFMKTAIDAVNTARRGGTAAEIRKTFDSDPSKSTIGGAGQPAPVEYYRPDALRGSNDKEGMSFNEGNRPSASEEYKINFQPNLFDNFDTYTYHWKLFITSLSNAYDGTVLAPEDQTIIAETGVTDLTLEKVEMNGIAVPSVEGGTGTQTTLRFQITEPQGAGLFDKLFYESLALGIGNWLVMPCFMQLEFKGRNDNNAEAPESGRPGDLNGLKWIWPIKLTNCKAHVSHVGTRYDFEAIVYDELAQSNAYFGIQHNIVLTQLSTFKSAIDQLQDKIQKDQDDKLMDNYGYPDVYRFVIDEQIAANANITVPDKNKHTSRWSDYAKWGDKQAEYNAGTSIDKIVDSLLGNTDYYQRKLQSAQTRISEPDSANEADSMRKFWRIVTETHPYIFDPIRQDNAVEITIYIVEYDIGLLETTPPQTGQTPDTLQAAKKRMSTYFNKKILNKRYDYIFTGLNDQIIQFDLNMNFSFAAALSRFGGIYYDTAGSDMGVVAQDFALTERRLATHLNQQLKFINSAEFKGDKAAAYEKLSTEVGQKAGASEESEKRFNATIEKAKRGKLNSNTAFKEGIAESRAQSANSLSPANTQKLRFISDVDVNSSTAKTAAEQARAQMKGKLRPIPYREAPQENNLAFGGEPTSDAARARTASLFSTALYSTLDASLQTIKIVIKGDPYWLFPRQLDEDLTALPYKARLGDSEAVKVIKEIHKEYTDSVNLFGTDNFIIVRLRTPKVANDSTGQVDRPDDPSVEVETFSGVYKVITIVNKFENGKFTQELFCLLDPIINLSDFINEIETKSGRKPSATTNTPNQQFRKSEIADMNLSTDPSVSDDGIKQASAEQAMTLSQSNIPAAGYKVAEALNRLEAQSKTVNDIISKGKTIGSIFGSLGG